MRPHIRLGRVFGIPIGLHYTWFIVAALIGFSLAGHFRLEHPRWSGDTIFWLSASTSLLFFASLLVHELSHAIVATRHGLRVRAIVLFALGGQAQIEGEAPSAATELRLGAIGPLVSVLLGVIFLGVAQALGWQPEREPVTPLPSMLVWLGYINLMLGAFNMLPAFPLDGGRVLRALLWWRSGDSAKATQTAAGVGQALAYGLIMLGLTGFVLTGGFGGLWMSLIGWFLLESARESSALVTLRAMLADVRVRALMRPPWPAVDADLPLDRFVFDRLLSGGASTYAVTRGDHVEGVVTPREVQQIEQPLWTRVTVEQVMQPLDRVSAVSPDQPVLEVMEQMSRDDVEEIAVVDHGEVKGVFTRTGVLEYLHRRSELHV